MRRVLLVAAVAVAVLGVFVSPAGAATFATNADCLACHDVAGTGAVSRVDFTAAVDYSKCVRCHWVTVGPSWGFPHEKVVIVPNCSECHRSQDATARWAGEFATPFGLFAGADSLAKPPASVHAAHVSGSWPAATFGSYCRSCHGAVGCEMCHSAPVGHGRHVADAAPSLPEYAPATYLTSYGSTPSANTRYEQNYFSTVVPCAAAGCHPVATLTTTPKPSCSSCHPARVEPHGYEQVDHVADDSAALGVTCSACHALDLDTEHGGGACATCHPSPRDSLSAWDQTCVTGGCHSPTSPAPFHEAAQTGHALPTAADPCGECHEGTDLAAVHAGAEDGAGNTSCLVCHGSGRTPATNDCSTCHFTMEAHPGGVHAAPSSTGCAGAGCHDISDVRTNHEGSPLGACAVCHKNPSRVPVLPADSECVRCHPSDDGVPHYTDHWADPTLIQSGSPRYAFYTGSAPGGAFTTACATCHTSNLIDAHIGSLVTLPQRDRFGDALTCASCHASADPAVRLAIAGGATKCDACHKNPITGGPGVHGPINPTHTSTFKDAPEVPCAPCHSSNIVDEHNGGRVFPDANGVLLAYCDVCHANYAGARGQQVQDAIELTNDVRCTACHGATHPDEGGHMATSSASLACGSCHAAGQTSIDVRSLHTESSLGPCAVCHANPTRVPDVTAETAECSSCHAAEGVDYHGGLPGKHVYGDMPVTCLGSTCHTSNKLPEAHEPFLSRYPDYASTCALCHANVTPGRIPAGATAVCDSCHAPIHPNMDHQVDESGECVDCHASADVLTLHASAVGGPCEVCHANPARVPTLPDSVECVNCHAYSPVQTKHYPTGDHTAASMDRGLSAGGLARATCAVCHDVSLYPAHGSMSASFYGPELSCVECHTDTRSNGQQQVLANWTSDRCDDCHTSGSKPMHSASSAPPVLATSSAGCGNGNGCHPLADLHAIHRDADTCALAGCHDIKNLKPTKTSCGIGGACHPAMSGDHRTEHDTQGRIDSGCYGCHFRYLTEEHAALGYSCATCHASVNATVRAAIAAKDRRCLTCHPDSAHNARQASEFAAGNASMHRVRADLPGMRSSFVVNGTTYAWSLPGASTFLKTGYAVDSVVSCDACHTYSGTTGPHGATMKVNIDPAYPNPYKVVNGAESYTAQLSANSPTGMSMTKNGSSAAKIICEKCHDLNGTGTSFSNIAHKEHDDRGREGSYCNQCHVAIPHGWGRPRLIGYVSDAAPYRTYPGAPGSQDGGLARISIKNYSPNGWSKSDCGAGCSSSRHPLTGTSWPNQMGGAVPPAPVATNWARTGTATASSVNGSDAAAKAIDGSTSTLWRSNGAGTQWLRVDLGTSRAVSKVVVNWNNSYYAKAYRIETSSDGWSWTTRFSTTSGASGTRTHTFASVSARYVRITCTTANSSDYRINEFEVWDF